MFNLDRLIFYKYLRNDEIEVDWYFDSMFGIESGHPSLNINGSEYKLVLISKRETLVFLRLRVSDRS